MHIKQLNKSVTRRSLSHFTACITGERVAIRQLGWSYRARDPTKATYTQGRTRPRVKRVTRSFMQYISIQQGLYGDSCAKTMELSIRPESVAAGSYLCSSMLFKKCNRLYLYGMGCTAGQAVRAGRVLEAGETITVSGNLKLYAVVFNRSR